MESITSEWIFLAGIGLLTITGIILLVKQSTLIKALEQKQNSLAESEQDQIQALKLFLSEQFQKGQAQGDTLAIESRRQAQSDLFNMKENLLKTLNQQSSDQLKQQIEHLQAFQKSLNEGTKLVSSQTAEALKHNIDIINQRMENLTKSTEAQLKDISGHVDKRLSEGFEKTTSTFADVVKRLTIIDEAQKKITELSGNVVSLQEILVDKRTRGAFGEVQLESLIRNVIPNDHYSMQHTLSNGKRVDCLLFLPHPTGNVPIDAKFPLESFQKLTSHELPDTERKSIETQFKSDIKKHIDDISKKYLIPGETSEGAILFLPAEAIFAEIHANYPDIIQLAHKQRVWIVSPTTLMAILTTARAVIKDEATRKQVHIIQEHLAFLAKDFERFQTRMDNLSRHVGNVQTDVDQIHTSARKITSRFKKIENVQMDKTEALLEDVMVEE